MQTIQVGSILIEESPRMTQVLGLESEPYSGNWRLVKLVLRQNVVRLECVWNQQHSRGRV